METHPTSISKGKALSRSGFAFKRCYMPEETSSEFLLTLPYAALAVSFTVHKDLEQVPVHGQRRTTGHYTRSRLGG